MGYVCVLSTDNYLEGVLLLNENLKKVKSKYDLLCLINENISDRTKDILNFFNIKTKVISKVDYSNINKDNPYWIYTFDKFNIFLLEEYKKIVYLDSDLLILENLDYLFDYPSISMPHDIPFNPSKFNSGIMVIEPNKDIFNDLKDLSIKSNKDGRKISDQDIFNEYFDDINELPSNFVSLKRIIPIKNELFNVICNKKEEYYSVISYTDYIEDPHVIHYIGTIKPFMLVDDIFDDKYTYLYWYYLYNIRKNLSCYYNILCNELISIIIPVYNKEKNIARCLNSVIGQTYKNIEIIIVDDCSSDNSFNICKEYADKDSRIKLYKNNKNRGVSYTRNFGIDKCNGQWIGFVDADDYIDRKMYETLYNRCKLEDLDVCQCKVVVNDGEKITGELADRLILTDKDEIFRNYLLNFITFVVYDKLYRSDIIKGKVYFKEDYKKNEDSFFVFQMLNEVKNYGFINDVLYSYAFAKDNSLTGFFDINVDKNLLDIMDYVKKYIYNNSPKNAFFLDVYLAHTYGYLFINIIYLPNKSEVIKKKFVKDAIKDAKKLVSRIEDIYNETEICQWLTDIINDVK